VEIIPFFHNGNLGKKYWKDIFGSFAIKNRLLSENYDIIHQIGTNSICLYLQLLMGKKIAIQTLHEVTAHETKTDLRSKIFLKIIGNRNKNGIIVHSQTSLNRLTDYFRNTLKTKLLPQIYFVPFGLFETNLLYTTKNVEKDKNLVLFWGRITPYKGVDVLRKAFVEVTKQLPDAKLLIAGEGKTDEIGSNEKNIEIRNKLLTTNELIELNQQATIVVCPYLSASQSGIPMVTFLFATAIIATRTGAFTEIINDGENGLLVDSGDVEQLANAIIKLLLDNKLQKKINNNIKQQFSDENSVFSWKNIAAQTEQAYKKTINKII
jgi:glycosyltransferase involved in cell wall biosynthesis